MATVVNNPPSGSLSDRTYIERATDGDTAGWAIAIILLLVVVALGLFFWVRSNNGAIAPATTGGAPTTNINVTSPSANNPGAPSAVTDGTGMGGTGSGSSGNTSGSGTGTVQPGTSDTGSGAQTY
jgi:hypothetical protein